jgi:hypothetical protein
MNIKSEDKDRALGKAQRRAAEGKLSKFTKKGQTIGHTQLKRRARATALADENMLPGVPLGSNM